MKSRHASKGTAEAANQAAERAFGKRQPLALLPDGGIPPEWEGRRSLAGAFFIKIERIRPDPDQPRKILDPESLRELTDSIRTLGILQPITVRFVPADGMYQILTGERRYLAAKEAGLAEIPCWEQTPADRQVLVRQVVENWQRADLHPFDLADTLMQLRDVLGYSQKEIAKLTGKPESEISKILKLLKLRRSIQQQYRSDKSGTLSRRHLENIAMMPEDEQEAFHERVTEESLTAKETERIVQQTLERRHGQQTLGAPKSTRRQFVTPKGTVIVVLRKRHPGTADILEVLDLARRQLKEDAAGE